MGLSFSGDSSSYFSYLLFSLLIFLCSASSVTFRLAILASSFLFDFSRPSIHSFKAHSFSLKD